MKSKAAIIRNQLPPVLLSLAVVVALLGLDVWLGYRKMVYGNSAETIEGAHQPHPRLGWVPRPGIARHDRPGNFSVRYGIGPDGLRRVPGSDADGDPARAQLWLFGDSFVFGHGVADEDTFASVLARGQVGERFVVRNAGVMGYGMPQHVQRLVELADRIQPGDQVVLAPISVGVERNMKHFGHTSKYIFREEKGHIEGFPDLRNGRLEIVPFDTPGNRVRSLLYNARLTGRGLQRLHHLFSPPNVTQDALELIEMAERIVEARGARLTWLFLPHPRECLMDGYRVDLSPLEFRDLKGYFPRSPVDVASIHFRDDRHWNARGHALAAHALARVLADEGVIALDDSRAGSSLAGPRGR